MIIKSDDKERVEVRFHVQRTEDDTIIATREIIIYPVNGKGVQWNKRHSREEGLFELPADQIPGLIERLATGLMFPADGSHI